jgi:hypothetical protein
VVSGLQRDDQVVSVGSFALRAEHERLGLPDSAMILKHRRQSL